MLESRVHPENPRPVSAPCAEAMAAASPGWRARPAARYLGVTGPDGGSPTKPWGTSSWDSPCTPRGRAALRLLRRSRRAQVAVDPGRARHAPAIPRKSTHETLLLGIVILAAACSTVKPLDRGLALARQGQYREAREAFDEAIRRSPASSAAYSHRADVRMRLGEVGRRGGGLHPRRSRWR